MHWTPVHSQATRLSRSVRALAAAALVGVLVTSGVAEAAEEAVLTCGDQQFVVSGFGRGEVLHVSGGTSNYVVTSARVAPDGPVLVDIPGQSGKEDVVTCSATSPLSGRTFIFEGFFTPRG